MPATRVTLTVELENGEVHSVQADQRDFAKAEAAGMSKDRVHTWVRFCAWNAMRRTKLYAGDWEKFNDVDCVEASDVVEPEVPAGDESGLDPGRRTRRAAS